MRGQHIAYYIFTHYRQGLQITNQGNRDNEKEIETNQFEIIEKNLSVNDRHC